MNADDQTEEWLSLLERMAATTAKVSDCVAGQVDGDPSARVSFAFSVKASRTLEGVVLLLRAGLTEQAQALVRVLIELQITFEYFLKMAKADLPDTLMRMNDSMLLEKVKQMRASGFKGLDLLKGAPSQADLEAAEETVRDRYSEDELKSMRRHGFTGLSLADRAIATGNGDLYDIVFRNFSRNIHSTDYMEHHLKLGVLPPSITEDYLASRDAVTLDVAMRCIGVIVDAVNAIRVCDYDAELAGIREEFVRLKSPGVEQ